VKSAKRMCLCVTIDGNSLTNAKACLPAYYYASVTVSYVGCAKTAERIDVLFGMETPGNPGNIVLDGVPIPYDEGVQCGFCKITLATY